MQKEIKIEKNNLYKTGKWRLPEIVVSMFIRGCASCGSKFKKKKRQNMQQQHSFTIDRRHMETFQLLVLEFSVFNHKGFLFDIVEWQNICALKSLPSIFFYIFKNKFENWELEAQVKSLRDISLRVPTFSKIYKAFRQDSFSHF